MTLKISIDLEIDLGDTLNYAYRLGHDRNNKNKKKDHKNWSISL